MLGLGLALTQPQQAEDVALLLQVAERRSAYTALEGTLLQVVVDPLRTEWSVALKPGQVLEVQLLPLRMKKYRL